LQQNRRSGAGHRHHPLLDSWTPENRKNLLEGNGGLPPEEIAEAVVFMLTRPRHVTIRDIVILPQNQDI